MASSKTPEIPHKNAEVKKLFLTTYMVSKIVLCFVCREEIENSRGLWPMRAQGLAELRLVGRPKAKASVSRVTLAPGFGGIDPGRAGT